MRRAILFCVIAIFAVLPVLLMNRYVLHIGVMVCIMGTLALSMNLMLRIGQLSLAQVAFMGIGAYSSALLTMRVGLPPLAAFAASGLLALISAVVLGPLFLRIKGVYFVLLTFAFAQVVNLIFQEWTDVLGGNNGIFNIPKLRFFGTVAVVNYYLFGLVVLAVSYAAVALVCRSRIGAVLASLEENEALSRSLGLSALTWRVSAFALSALLAGLSGSLYAHYLGFISPAAFTFLTSIDVLAINVVGGAAMPLGAILGAILLVPLPELLRDAMQYQLLAYGLLLILIVAFFPQGIAGALLRTKRKGRQ